MWTERCWQFARSRRSSASIEAWTRSSISEKSGTMEFRLTDALEVLERTPSTFRALLQGLSEAWITPNEGPETFSAFDNLGHMIHGEKTDWIPRARIILAQGPNRRFEPFDRFAQYRESEGKSLADLLAEFERVRAE